MRKQKISVRLDKNILNLIETYPENRTYVINQALGYYINDVRPLNNDVPDKRGTKTDKKKDNVRTSLNPHTERYIEHLEQEIGYLRGIHEKVMDRVTLLPEGTETTAEEPTDTVILNKEPEEEIKHHWWNF